jgi:NADPH-dependent 2,4-dienoyl-CoA reductase/sulfur reductase-like enzyme/rhodanese-related sulfurtransferase
MSERILIVGGVAGGGACAARLRRLDERAAIVMFERGPYVSYANCGLPYYVGGVIADRRRLLAVTPEQWRRWFNIEVRTRQEVVALDRARRRIEVCELESGRRYQESYDALVLAPGAAPLRPAWPGVDLPGVFTLRSIPDSRALREWIENRQPRRAIVVGAGFLGLEMTENLARRGLRVTLLEKEPQVLPMLDREMAQPLQAHLETHRVDVRLQTCVTAIEATAEGALAVRADSGAVFSGDLVLLALGVRPEIALAREAGLEIGAAGGIRVDEQMRTSDPHIWAVGDAVEVRDWVTGQWRLAALAGLAARQGRVAADAIAGRASRFRGAQATAVCGAFGMTAAATGASQKDLQAAGVSGYQAVYVHPLHHAGYYPGAKRMHLKLLFGREDGRILGAQAVGEEGVEKRMDVIALAIQKRATVFDLEEAELCYAPQYGSARDPVNLAGMAAANVVRGDMPLAEWSALGSTGALLVDVREPGEYARDHIEGAVNIPLGELRARLEELPREREIWLNCAVGQRAYYALRLLLQHGFRARNLSGGYLTYWGWNP